VMFVEKQQQSIIALLLSIFIHFCG